MKARSDARTLLRLLRAALAAGVIVWVGSRLATEWQANPAPAFRPAPLELTLAVVCAATALIGLALLFVSTLRLVGPYEHRNRHFYARIWFQGYFWRYVPGKVMLVVERVRLGEKVGIPRATSVLLVLWETLLLLAGAFVLATAALPLVSTGAVLTQGALAPATIAAMTVMLIGGLLLFPPLLRIAAHRLPWLQQRLSPALLALGPFQLGRYVLGYAIVWLLLGASFAFTCRCFEGGQNAGLEVALLYVFGYVAGLVLSVTPAGLGVREGLVVAGLSGTFPATAGLAFALASRVLMTVVELVLVAISTRIEPFGAAVEPTRALPPGTDP